MKPLPFPALFALEIVITVASAALLAALAPPLNLHPLQWLAYVPMMLIILLGTPDRRGFRAWISSRHTWLALIYGIVAQSAIFWWIIDTITSFSNLPWAAAVGILALFSLVFGMPYTVMWWVLPPIRRFFGTWWVLALPAAAVVIEWLGAWFLLFPYNQGVAQYRVLPTFQLVGLTGIYGVTFLVLFVNAAIAEAVLAHREGRLHGLRWVAAAAAAWGLVNTYGVIRLNIVDRAISQSPAIHIYQVQDEIQMHERMGAYPCETWNFWFDQTAALSPGEVDLVIWPEGGSVYPLNVPRRAQRYRGAPCKDIDEPLERLKELAHRLEAELVIGASAIEFFARPDGGRDRRNLNSVYHIAPSGEVARYDKIIPLPFGEYLPLSDTFPFLRDLIEGPGNFQAGTDPVVFEGKVRLSTPICYEAILPHLCRRFDNPDILINGTLDTWFGDTAAPHQHAMLAAIRAVELGRPLIRSAYTGVSMVVEPSGRIYAETPPFERVSRVVKVRVADTPTLYRLLSPFGLQDWFTWLCLIGLIVGRLVRPWHRQGS